MLIGHAGHKALEDADLRGVLLAEHLGVLLAHPALAHLAGDVGAQVPLEVAGVGIGVDDEDVTPESAGSHDVTRVGA